MSRVSKLLLTSDLHLTDREADRSRFEIFDVCARIQERERGSIQGWACLGDLTEFKDRHSSALTHATRAGVERLPFNYKLILKGNHDYVDEGEPFFDFLHLLPGVHYVSRPEVLSFEGHDLLLLPHTRDVKAEWARFDGIQCELVLAHLTVQGARSEQGAVLDGVPRNWIPGNCPVISGDIHLPQRVDANFEYVGSPYSTRFGQDYIPRVLLVTLEQGKPVQLESIPTHLERRVVVRVRAGDLAALPTPDGETRVRVMVDLPAGTTPQEWEAHRRAVLARIPNAELVPQLEHAAVAPTDAAHATETDEELYERFCASAQVDSAFAAAGRRYLERSSSDAG